MGIRGERGAGSIVPPWAWSPFASVERVIAALSEEIALLEQQVEQTLRERPAECQRAARPRTAPGVGPKTSWALVADLPEPGQLSRRQDRRRQDWPSAVNRRRAPGRTPAMG